MRLNVITAKSSSHSLPQFLVFNSFSSRNPFSFPRNPISPCTPPVFLCKSKPSRFVPIFSSNPGKYTDSTRVSSRGVELDRNSKDNVVNEDDFQGSWNVEVGNPVVPSYVPPPAKSLSDQAFFLLAFIACTTSVAFTSLVIAAVPTLFAMGKAATSLSKLADTAREELPSTMAAIRLSGMEISDLTLELSDLSQEIADGVNKSAQAVQAAEAGVRQIGTLARQQTLCKFKLFLSELLHTGFLTELLFFFVWRCELPSIFGFTRTFFFLCYAAMIQERASLPIISLQPVVTGAARKTSRAVGRATKTFMNIISRGEFSSENENDNSIDRLDI
ncbi:hypothetical protein HS088_TW04G01164 [Tripterygium wilfordii]|uniref:Uncharacterized protein n=1 Tax=Tripterygium wilfordii TaxID=458696 RepID=A0A7J7DSB8_TRIWF|nr:hypothetical protein HS088_TW04G01164 [Tripterygium wilfordii]